MSNQNPAVDAEILVGLYLTAEHLFPKIRFHHACSLLDTVTFFLYIHCTLETFWELFPTAVPYW